MRQQLNVRVPEELVDALRGRAAEEDRSLNNFVVRILRQALDGEQPRTTNRPDARLGTEAVERRGERKDQKNETLHETTHQCSP